MDPNIKALWLHDLRSGSIPQTTDVLAKDNSRCCLGVLSDIAVRNGAARVNVTDYGIFYGTNEDDGDDTNLPKGIANWCGLDYDAAAGPSIPASIVKGDPRIKYNSITDNNKVYLATLNDEGFTFEEIADLIEKNL